MQTRQGIRESKIKETQGMECHRIIRNKQSTTSPQSTNDGTSIQMDRIYRSNVEMAHEEYSISIQSTG